MCLAGCHKDPYERQDNHIVIERSEEVVVLEDKEDKARCEF